MQRELTDQEKIDIENKIAWEGFEYYFIDYLDDGYFDGTVLEDCFREFRTSFQNLKDALEYNGIDSERLVD